nr:hypothetical protein [Micromonospora sp. DSM 115978]
MLGQAHRRPVPVSDPGHLVQDPVAAVRPGDESQDPYRQAEREQAGRPLGDLFLVAFDQRFDEQCLPLHADPATVARHLRV